MKIRLIAFLFIFALSCSSRSSVPKGIIPPHKMQSVVFDLLRGDELVNEYVVRDTSKKRDVEAIKLYKQVFMIHNTNKDQFFKSYKYYQAHPDKNKAIFDSLSAWTNRNRTYASFNKRNMQPEIRRTDQ